jgi:pimeloyl-ACP methyl ester carboxylesterase/DNA-binding winged helix-turn-helix (wHTH) protein
VQFFFGNHTIDTEVRELVRGGSQIAVQPQVFDLLVYLIANRERVVSKDDLISRIWGGRIVSDSTLTSRINAARTAIDDSGTVQRLIRTFPKKGFRFIGEVTEQADRAGKSTITKGNATPPQQVTFCRTRDGVNLAIATSGNGLPVVKTGTWLTHVERDWQSPLWSPLFSRLSSQFQLVRYDPRGCGLSDWEAPQICFDKFVSDLEEVVDTLKLKRFALFGVSQGAAISIAYAARHPERVSRLALSSGFPLGWRRRGNIDEKTAREAILTLMRHGWGQDNPAFRQVFNLRMWPEAMPDQALLLDDLQRISTSPENAIQILRAIGDLDISALLPQISVPTLVLHSRGDVVNPIELGLTLARKIPRCRFVEIDSRNHIPLSHEPAWTRYVDELSEFLGDDEG